MKCHYEKYHEQKKNPPILALKKPGYYRKGEKRRVWGKKWGKT
jgi:hypothetical protein